mmetsp:Transcript_6254/g.17825  ORF Transcript_6254/g.17825 Transcript_6254/m.17825 type:complete len:379 (-) Transcript_6254:1114-2250(-)
MARDFEGLPDLCQLGLDDLDILPIDRFGSGSSAGQQSRGIQDLSELKLFGFDPVTGQHLFPVHVVLEFSLVFGGASDLQFGVHKLNVVEVESVCRLPRCPQFNKGVLAKHLAQGDRVPVHDAETNLSHGGSQKVLEHLVGHFRRRVAHKEFSVDLFRFSVQHGIDSELTARQFLPGFLNHKGSGVLFGSSDFDPCVQKQNTVDVETLVGVFRIDHFHKGKVARVDLGTEAGRLVAGAELGLSHGTVEEMKQKLVVNVRGDVSDKQFPIRGNIGLGLFLLLLAPFPTHGRSRTALASSAATVVVVVHSAVTAATAHIVAPSVSGEGVIVVAIVFVGIGLALAFEPIAGTLKGRISVPSSLPGAVAASVHCDAIQCDPMK